MRLLAAGRIAAASGATRCLLLERDGDGALLDGARPRRGGAGVRRTSW